MAMIEDLQARSIDRVFDVNFAENPIGRKVVILEPLSPGKHDIHFKASLTNPTTGILFVSLQGLGLFLQTLSLG